MKAKLPGEGLYHYGYLQFPNFYAINWDYAYNPQTLNNRETRGGPAMINPPGYQFDLSANSDQQKKSNSFILEAELIIQATQTSPIFMAKLIITLQPIYH